MVVRVQLKGLNITKGRQPNSWYVYPRGGGDAILSGFIGTREELEARLAEPETLQAYNRPRLSRKPAADFGADTLGGIIHWFTNGDIDRDLKEALASPSTDANGYPKWKKLSEATRKDYLAGYDYLRSEFDIPLNDITQPDLYDLRDKCAVKKWPRFADKMIAALSSMFKQGVKRKKLLANPCLGMDKAHEADPNANREWFGAEWDFVRASAPMEVLIPCMVARYAGLAGQTIFGLAEKQIQDDPTGPTGKAVQYTRRKNKKATRLPVMIELQTFLAGRKVCSADGLIAIRDDGSAWPSEKEMQTRVSHWLRDQERAGHIGSGTTLHGLRVSYAAWWKRMGASDSEVAGLIGDKSVRMGTHYTRHVEDEAKIIRAFDRVKDKA